MPKKAVIPDESHKDYIIEVAKILLSNNLEYIRGVSQILQGLTSILLTSYIALLVGFRKEIGLNGLGILVISFTPIVCWSGSLVLGFAKATLHTRSGSQFFFGDLESTIEAYEDVVKRRRAQLLWPSILSLIGLVSFAVSFFLVFLPPNRVP